MQHVSRHARQVTWRYVSRGDIAEFYGDTLRETVRSVALTLDGNVEGIIGIARTKNGHMFFSDYTDDMANNIRRFAVYRAIKVVMAWVEDSPAPVGAVAIHDEGHRLLKKLGFTRLFGDQYLWLGHS